MRKILTSLVAATLALGHVVRAEDRTPETVSAPQPVAKPASKQATLTELGTMLENIGYEVTPAKNEKNETFGWDTQYAAEGMTVYARVELSKNGKFVWVTGILASIKQDEEVPQKMFANLLALNQDVGPAFAQWDAKRKKFSVCLAVSNSNLSPADLRAAMNTYTNGMKQAVAVWRNTTKSSEAE